MISYLPNTKTTNILLLIMNSFLWYPVTFTTSATQNKRLYSDAQDEPIDTLELDTIEDAENYYYAERNGVYK